MGFFDNIKKGTQSYLDDWKKSADENRQYKNELNQALKEARREAYKEEAIKQAKLKAKLQAKQKFNPKKKSAGFGNGMTEETKKLLYSS